MKNVVLIVLLASVSVWSIADNHGGSGKGRKAGLFKQMDADGDGNISAQEHEQAIAEMVSKRRERFTAMDVDGNGIVTKEEAKAMRGNRSKKGESSDNKKN